MLHTVTSFVAGAVGDRDTARTEAHSGLAVARRLATPTVLANALTHQGHALCVDDPRDALGALEEAIGLYDTGAGDVMLPVALMDAAVLRAVASDPAGAAETAGRAVDHATRDGNRFNVADAVAVATLVLAGHPDHVEAALTVDGARHGPILGIFPPSYSGIHQTRIQTALDHVATTLGPDAYAVARQRGAAMTYDEIIAYTLDQLGQRAD